MAKILLVNRESGALRLRLREIADASDPRSSRMDRFRTELSLKGVAQVRRAFARLAASILKKGG